MKRRRDVQTGCEVTSVSPAGTKVTGVCLDVRCTILTERLNDFPDEIHALILQFHQYLFMQVISYNFVVFIQHTLKAGP